MARSTHAADRWFMCGQGFSIHRRYEQPRRKEEPTETEAIVQTDLVDICDMDSSGRLKWLETALMQAARGRIKANLVVDIIEQSSFAAGLDNTVGGQMHALVISNLHLFTNQQQKLLSSADCPLRKFEPVQDHREMKNSDGCERRKRAQDKKTRDGNKQESSTRAAEIAQERHSGDDPKRHRKEDQEKTKTDDSVEHDCIVRGERSSAQQDQPEGRSRRRRRDHSDEDSAVKGRRRRNDDTTVSQHDPSERAAQNAPQADSNGEVGGSGIVVWEEKREECSDADVGADFLARVLDEIKSVGIHASQNWNPRELALCKQRLVSLKQALLGETTTAEFESHLSSFQGKKESALSFLQYLLALLKNSYTQELAAEAALFLCLTIILLPIRTMRVALHERVLTLKKQLEEGSSR